MEKIITRVMFIIIGFSCILHSCGGNDGSFIEGKYVLHFDNLIVDTINYEIVDTINYEMDLNHEIFSSIIIPSENKDSTKYFKLNFKKNEYSGSKKYFYKIFYQNTSYKFDELDNITNTYNQLSSENFYGSWEDVNMTFKMIKESSNNFCTDSFRIIGNPRNEKKYYQSKPIQKIATKEKIDKILIKIKNNSEWYDKIKEKAKMNNISLKEQLRLDAIWIVETEKGEDIVNNRWMRNPRVGSYEFILVVASENDLKKIPDYIKNISKKNNDSLYVNPFYYFLYGEGSKFKETKILKSDKVVNVTAKLNFKTGLYVDLFELKKTNYDKKSIRKECNTSEKLFNYAHFEQFFHNINKNFPLNNIPVIKDVVQEYSMDDYNLNKKKYDDTKRVKKNVQITDCPCETVNYNSEKEIFEIIVPGSTEKMRKENVGIKSRIGFTYGKYIAKIKFPKLINKDNVWNGLTHAFWLIHQEDAGWNQRRECKGGYIPHALNWASGIREKTSHYSEIDIEIVKVSEFWPNTSYKSGISPKDNPADNRDIIVACTNWDLACEQPENFSVGAKKFSYDGNEYELHRWDHGYKAITHKAVVDHDWLLGEYSYFQIDWQPDKIIWSIGKDLDKMKVICRMDSSVTSIPNNQMIIVITQEFHDGDWWPTTPFHQDNIPFPEKDVKAEIMEILIK